LRHAALGLLSRRPASGYDLLKVFEASMANVWPATQSQLYGELNKLADTGLIEAAELGPRGRKEYAITEAGRAELRRWMTSPQEDPAFRSAQLLRVFLLDGLPRGEARAYLTALRAHAASEHRRYARIRENNDWREDDEAFFARAALENGLRFTQMEADWASWVLDELDKRGTKAPPSDVASR
jgi:DNA-binding PadR family transcriptional regulator